MNLALDTNTPYSLMVHNSVINLAHTYEHASSPSAAVHAADCMVRS